MLQYKAVKAKLHAFLTWIFREGEQSASLFDHFAARCLVVQALQLLLKFNQAGDLVFR
jgi:hypothetical protein